ncbi:hypothetical protein BS78_04G009500 [Paspalum vaginatum]|nr:hypothetical protein BS78_04G009500 [Paspalum vaginatum]
MLPEPANLPPLEADPATSVPGSGARSGAGGGRQEQVLSSSQEEPLAFCVEGREVIAVAGGHESGHGLFRADVSTTEAQEVAKGYHCSLSSPSTSPLHRRWALAAAGMAPQLRSPGAWAGTGQMGPRGTTACRRRPAGRVVEAARQPATEGRQHGGLLGGLCCSRQAGRRRGRPQGGRRQRTGEALRRQRPPFNLCK